MELLQLLIFRDIARERNFSKVAKIHHLTQPAISSRLKQLEEHFGVKLFERVPRKVMLTQEGEFLLPYVEDLIRRCDNMTALVAQCKQEAVGELRVAATYSVGIYELSNCLREFIRAYPKIRIHLQYRRSDIIYDLLIKKKVDLGVVAYPEQRARIDVENCGSDKLVLVVPKKHQLASRKSIRLEKIAGEDFIAFDEGIPTRAALDRAFAERGISVNVRVTNENIDTLKRAVEAGIGISILPQMAVRDEVKKGRLHVVKFSDYEMKRPLGVLSLKDRVRSYPMQLFTEMLLREFGCGQQIKAA